MNVSFYAILTHNIIEGQANFGLPDLFLDNLFVNLLIKEKMVQKISKLRKKSIFPYLMLGVGIISIGLSAIFVKNANLPGTVSSFYRFFFALLCIVPIQIKRGWKNIKISNLVFVILGGLFFATDLILWNTSLILIPASTATILANNAPIWVGLGTIIFFKKKLKFQYWLGVILSVIGIILTIGVANIFNLKVNLGVVLSIIAGMFYAGYLLITEKERRNIDTFTFMFITVLIGTIYSFLINLIAGKDLVGFNTNVWLNLLGLGIISHFIGWVAINHALGYLPASVVSVTLLGQILVTTILAYFILDEKLQVLQYIGGMILILGIFLANKQKEDI